MKNGSKSVIDTKKMIVKADRRRRHDKTKPTEIRVAKKFMQFFTTAYSHFRVENVLKADADADDADDKNVNSSQKRIVQTVNKIDDYLAVMRNALRAIMIEKSNFEIPKSDHDDKRSIGGSKKKSRSKSSSGRRRIRRRSSSSSSSSRSSSSNRGKTDEKVAKNSDDKDNNNDSMMKKSKPIEPKQQQQPQQQQHICGICLDSIISVSSGKNQDGACSTRFALLEGCAHAYCGECMRKLLQTSEQQVNDSIKCPTCRAASSKVAFVPGYIEPGERKTAIFGTIQCARAHRRMAAAVRSPADTNLDVVVIVDGDEDEAEHEDDDDDADDVGAAEEFDDTASDPDFVATNVEEVEDDYDEEEDEYLSEDTAETITELLNELEDLLLDSQQSNDSFEQ